MMLHEANMMKASKGVVLDRWFMCKICEASS